MQSLSVDRNIQDVLVPLTKAEWQLLEMSILTEGCRDPIIVWNNTIVDGHNRYEICRRNRIEFNTVKKEFSDKDEAVEWVVNNQLGRRNLSNWKKIKIGEKLRDYFEKKAKAKQSKAGGDRKSDHAKSLFQESGKAKEDAFHTDEEIGKKVGVSRDTVRKAAKILEHSEKRPDIIELLDNDEISINKAYETITGEVELLTPVPKSAQKSTSKRNKVDSKTKTKTDLKPGDEIGTVSHEVEYSTAAELIGSEKCIQIILLVLSLLSADDRHNDKSVRDTIVELRSVCQKHE